MAAAAAAKARNIYKATVTVVNTFRNVYAQNYKNKTVHNHVRTDVLRMLLLELQNDSLKYQMAVIAIIFRALNGYTNENANKDSNKRSGITRSRILYVTYFIAVILVRLLFYLHLIYLTKCIFARSSHHCEIIDC